MSQAAPKIPECADRCFSDGTQRATGCDVDDYSCICDTIHRQPLDASALGCLDANCIPSYRTEFHEVIQTRCSLTATSTFQSSPATSIDTETREATSETTSETENSQMSTTVDETTSTIGFTPAASTSGFWVADDAFFRRDSEISIGVKAGVGVGVVLGVLVFPLVGGFFFYRRKRKNHANTIGGTQSSTSRPWQPELEGAAKFELFSTEDVASKQAFASGAQPSDLHGEHPSPHVAELDSAQHPRINTIAPTTRADPMPSPAHIHQSSIQRSTSVSEPDPQVSILPGPPPPPRASTPPEAAVQTEVPPEPSAQELMAQLAQREERIAQLERIEKEHAALQEKIKALQN